MKNKTANARTRAAALACLAWSASAAVADPSPAPAAAWQGDVAVDYRPAEGSYDYTKRVAMIPMRDGVQLHTVIIVPKGARNAPMILTRTPYSAEKRTSRAASTHRLSKLIEGDDVFAADDYIRVYQDVRGKYGSDGVYVMTRPARGPLNTTDTDHTTDARDTIEWLIGNTPESNGNVGMLGSSYEGYTVAMALLDPHPALKVAAPMHSMIDGWMGDDWFHYGAFRQNMLGFIYRQTAAKGEAPPLPSAVYDDYEGFLRLGSAGEAARAAGFDQLPWWRRVAEHPAYDAFWQGQALDKLLAQRRPRVPTLWVHGLWDQEDMWGTMAAYNALRAEGLAHLNHLVIGPWHHSQSIYQGASLGALDWEGDTARQFRRDVLKPFFDQHLKEGAPHAGIPAVLAYNTGENLWERFASWPLACPAGCAAALTPIYLRAGFTLDFEPPAERSASDSYVSDPAKPVPFVPRPVRFSDREAWNRWLVSDQRHVADRTDVLTYVTPALAAPVRISGAPVADLYASTTGSDADWVVKLIDVYPDEVPSKPPMGGYQLAVSMDIFRGRYRDSFEKPTRIPPGKVQRYRFVLPTTHHVFKPGHRIMIQVQSSLFPLYDRNPQTYVENIFWARPADYRPARHRIFRQAQYASAVWLPIAPDGATGALRLATDEPPN